MAAFYEMLKNADVAQGPAENPFYRAFAEDLTDGEKALHLKEAFLAAANGGPETGDVAKKFKVFLESAKGVCRAIQEGLNDTAENKMTAGVAGYLDACRDAVRAFGILKDACAAARSAAVSPRDTLKEYLADIETQESSAWAIEVTSAQKTPLYQTIVETDDLPSRRADLVAALFVASGASGLERDWRLQQFTQFVDVLRGASRKTGERIAQLTPATATPDGLKEEFHLCGRMIEFCGVLKDGCSRAGADFSGDASQLDGLCDGFGIHQRRLLKLWQLVAGSERVPDPEGKISVYRPLHLKMGA